MTTASNLVSSDSILQLTWFNEIISTLYFCKRFASAKKTERTPGPHYNLRGLTSKGPTQTKSGRVTMKSRPSPHIYQGVDGNRINLLSSTCAPRRWNDSIHFWSAGYRQQRCEKWQKTITVIIRIDWETIEPTLGDVTTKRRRLESGKTLETELIC